MARAKKDDAKLRSHVIPVRVTETVYQELERLASGYDLTVSTFCYLSVRRALSFQSEIANFNGDDLL